MCRVHGGLADVVPLGAFDDDIHFEGRLGMDRGPAESGEQEGRHPEEQGQPREAEAGAGTAGTDQAVCHTGAHVVSLLIG